MQQSSSLAILQTMETANIFVNSSSRVMLSSDGEYAVDLQTNRLNIDDDDDDEC